MTSKIKTDESECVRLKEFKNFLSSLAEPGITTIGATNVDMRNFISYPCYFDELHAEVVMALLIHLQTKQCPHCFQIPLLRTTASYVLLESSYTKECIIKESTDDLIQFDLVKLQKFAVNNLEKLLTRLRIEIDNTHEDNLRKYAEADSICPSNTLCKCVAMPSIEPSFVSGHIKNKTRKMEDRHICIDRFGALYNLNNSYSFYGVFDGHCGPLAAVYAARQLPHLLADYLKKDNFNIYEALESSFLQADKLFARKCISSGSTAVCALLVRKPTARLYVAWVGDSKALLVAATASLQLVKSHKPSLDEERKRVESAGGAVMFVQGQWRVNGILNVSRSIGDFSVSAVIAEPDVIDVELSPLHDFLVLGTDGLFDHVTEAAIVDTVYTALINKEQTLDHIPNLLIEQAKEHESLDNITCVVVFLKERHQIVDNYLNATRMSS